MNLFALLMGVSLTVLITGGTRRSSAQEAPALTAEEIMARADSVSEFQDSLLAHTTYKTREEFIFNELDGKGQIKNADTVISVVTMKGKEELNREIVYTTRKKEEKKESSQEAGFSFSYSDPDYNFVLAETADSSYVIAISPKGDPEKGEVRGTLMIDKQSYFTKILDFEVPKPEGALKEFATKVSFEPLEGGLVVLREMQMKGFVKALFGIFKMRFSGSVRYSNYEILE